MTKDLGNARQTLVVLGESGVHALPVVIVVEDARVHL
jgi:hypothetical protein